MLTVLSHSVKAKLGGAFHPLPREDDPFLTSYFFNLCWFNTQKNRVKKHLHRPVAVDRAAQDILQRAKDAAAEGVCHIELASEVPFRRFENKTTISCNGGKVNLPPENGPTPPRFP